MRATLKKHDTKEGHYIITEGTRSAVVTIDSIEHNEGRYARVTFTESNGKKVLGISSYGIESVFRAEKMSIFTLEELKKLVISEMLRDCVECLDLHMVI